MSVFVAAWWGTSAVAGALQLTTTDGVRLAGDEFGAGAKCVLLVHDEGRTRADWASFAPKLASGGFHVVSFDLRPHGALADAEWPKLTADVDAGVAALKKKGCTEIHVVGARTGANLALAAAAANPAVTDLVLLSPQLVAHGMKVSSAIGAYAARPLMIVASADDALAVKTATFLEQSATGPKRLDTFPGAGSGAAMLNKVPDLENLVTAWMNGAFAQPAGVAASDGRLKTGEVGEIQSTGTRLEDRQR